MARIRTIKPEFWTDPKIVALPVEARLLFIGLWNFADDEGYLLDEPMRIKMQVFPGDCFDVVPLLDALVKSERLSRLTLADGRKILHIANFSRHQKISHVTPTRFQPLKTPEDSGKYRNVPENTGSFRPEGKGREGMVGDQEKASSTICISPPSKVSVEGTEKNTHTDPTPPERPGAFSRPPSPWDEMVPLTRGRLKEAPLCPECSRRTVWIETRPGERYNNDRWFCPKPPAGCGVNFPALDWEEKDGTLRRKPEKPKKKPEPAPGAPRFRVSKRFAPEVAAKQEAEWKAEGYDPDAPPPEKEDLPF